MDILLPLWSDVQFDIPIRNTSDALLGSPIVSATACAFDIPDDSTECRAALGLSIQIRVYRMYGKLLAQIARLARLLLALP